MLREAAVSFYREPAVRAMLLEGYWVIDEAADAEVVCLSGRAFLEGDAAPFLDELLWCHGPVALGMMR